MIAACDTFRSGAVEQLKTHCGRLGVPLYERGYEKDPAKVAAEAVKAAAREGCDVVLVDTAGAPSACQPPTSSCVGGMRPLVRDPVNNTRMLYDYNHNCRAFVCKTPHPEHTLRTV